jgi:TetR/AcrR family transcriptional repressor of mexJK operon
LFSDEGYGATSTDLVAKTAAVSKSTVYKLFPSKEDLLIASIIYGCEQRNVQLSDTDLRAKSLGDTLYSVACRFIDSFWSKEGITLTKLVISESRRAPRIGAVFMDAGPRSLHQALAEFLTAPASTGQLVLTDPHAVADLFISQLGGLTYLALLTDQLDEVSVQQRDLLGQRVVSVILGKRWTPS